MTPWARRAAALVLATSAAGCGLTTWFRSTSSMFEPPRPESLETRLAVEGSEPNGIVDHFAVLIGADSELRHRGNLSMAYQILLEQGYRRDRIYILDSEGDTPFFPLTDITTRAAIARLFEHLSKTIEPQDSLFVYVTGHGRRITADEDEAGTQSTLGVSTLVLNPGEELPQEEFFSMLESIKPEAGILFFDQCYWGPFSSPNLCNYVTITTSDPKDTSHGVSFPRAFWSAFRNPRKQGEAVSIFDAFKFAMVADRATTLGLNRPRISHVCVDPSGISLLGTSIPRSPANASN